MGRRKHKFRAGRGRAGLGWDFGSDFISGMGKHIPSRLEFGTGVGNDHTMWDGNGIRVPRPKPAPLSTLIGSTSLSKANVTVQTNRRGCGHGRGYFYGRGRGHSRDRHISWNQGDDNQPHNKKNNSNNQKLNYSEILP